MTFGDSHDTRVSTHDEFEKLKFCQNCLRFASPAGAYSRTDAGALDAWCLAQALALDHGDDYDCLHHT